MRAFDALLRGTLAARPVGSVDALWSALREHASEAPFERALRVGAAQDALGWAFAAGYLEAVTALVPATEGTRAVLCVTEATGNGAAAMKLAMRPEGDGFVVSGEKTFVTFGEEAEGYVVLGNAGPEPHDGRHARLHAFVVERGRPGLTLTPGPRTPFVPEIGHAKLRFEDVSVAAKDVLEGPGWPYARRFRVIEDVYVEAAVGAMVLRWAMDHGWDTALRSDLYAALRWRERFAAELGRVAVGTRLPDGMLVELDAAQRRLRALLETLPWDGVPGDVRGAFRRDQKLFQLAAGARAKRAAHAWRRLGA